MPRASRSLSNAIRLGEVAREPSGAAVGDQPLDLLDRHRRLLDPRRGGARRCPSTLSNRSNVCRTAWASAAPSSPASIAEFSARTRSNITPIAAALFTSCLMCAENAVDGFLQTARDLRVGVARGQRVEARKKIGEALQRLLRLRHRRPRELQLLAVVHAEIQVAQRGRPEAVIDDVLEVVDVAERLRHLFRTLASSSGPVSIIRCST